MTKYSINCVVDSVCDVNRMKLNIKLFNVQAMEGRYMWSSLPLNVFFFFFFFFLSLRVNLQCKPLFSKQAYPLLTKIMFIIFTTSWYDIKGELHPQPKISIFSALSSKLSPFKQIVKGTQKCYWNFSRPNSF